MKDNTTKTISTQLNKNQEIPEKLLKRALKRLELDDYQGAINDLDKAIEIKPDYAEAYFRRGMTYKTNGTRNKAITDFKRAIFFNLNSFELYYNLSYLLHKEERCLTLDLALLLNPDSYEALITRGLQRYEIKDFGGAVSDFEKAIQVNPGRSTPYEMVSEIKKKLNDIKASMAVKKKGAEMCENSVDELFYLSKVETCNENDEIEFYDRILALDPKNEKGYRWRAYAKNSLKDFEGAIADYSSLIDLDPQNAVYYFKRANVKIKADDCKGALDDLKEIAKLDPEFLELYFERRFMDLKKEHYIEILKSLMLNLPITNEEVISKLIKPTLM